MSKAEPQIQKFMTTQPYWIHAGQTLQKAQDMMSELKIRHLPVMNDDNEVVGVVSDRDIKMASGIEGVDPAKTLILDVCNENPYIVEPDLPLREVAEVMASRHYGSAIVMQNGKLVGIFTTVDACRAIMILIETRTHIH